MATIAVVMIFATVARPMTANAASEGNLDPLYGKLFMMQSAYQYDRDTLTPVWHYGWSFDANVNNLKAWWCTPDQGTICTLPTKDFAAFSLWYKENSRRVYFIDVISPNSGYSTSKVEIKKMLTDAFRHLSNKQESTYSTSAAALSGTPAPTGKIDTHIDKYSTRLSNAASDYNSITYGAAYIWFPPNMDVDNTIALKSWWCSAEDCTVMAPSNFNAFALWYKAHAKQVFFNMSIDGNRDTSIHNIKTELVKAYHDGHSSKNFSAYTDRKVEVILEKTKSGF